MLYIGYLIILDGQSIRKITFGKFPFFEPPRHENRISRLSPPPHTQIG